MRWLLLPVALVPLFIIAYLWGWIDDWLKLFDRNSDLESVKKQWDAGLIEPWPQVTLSGQMVESAPFIVLPEGWELTQTDAGPVIKFSAETKKFDSALKLLDKELMDAMTKGFEDLGKAGAATQASLLEVQKVLAGPSPGGIKLPKTKKPNFSPPGQGPKHVPTIHVDSARIFPEQPQADEPKPGERLITFDDDVSS
jgi:hypothetical protein